MKKISSMSMLVIVVLLLTVVGASAYSVSITKNYGGDYGDSHDVPYFPSDIYDFTGENFASIDSFTLSLTFSGTDDQYYSIVNFERWRVRLESGSYSYISDIFNTSLDLVLHDTDSNGDGTTTQVFTINSSVDSNKTGETPFTDMAAAQQFRLWFAEESANTHDNGVIDNDQFHLVSATVTAHGTSTVPIPGAIWLLGTGLLGLAGVRRYKN